MTVQCVTSAVAVRCLQCQSIILNHAYRSNLQDEFRGITKRIYSQDPRVPRPTRQEVKETFNKLEWTPEQTEGLENALVSQYVYSACIGNQVIF